MDVIILLKFFATILITNSHLGRIYPDQIDFLATGALVGNTLFCFASGYVLFNSRMKSVGMWFFRRLTRLYIPYWVFLAFTILVLGYAFQPKQIFISYYWFIAAMTVFYFFYFPVVRYFSKFIPHVIVLTLVAYIAVYYCNNHSTFIVEDVYHSAKLVWFYYFASMMIGALMCRHGRQVGRILYDGVITFGIVICYYLFKWLLIEGHVNMQLQVLFPLLSLPFAYYAYRTLSALNRKVNYNAFYGRIIKYISTLTLEIYIVQFAVISCVSKFDIPYGALRLVLTFAGIIAGAALLKLAVDGMISIFTLAFRITLGELQ